MERCKEYPNGRCAGCGYAGHELHGDHPYDDYDYLCSSCLSSFNEKNPWCVDKVEKGSGEVYCQWRYPTPEQAEVTLARLNSNPEADEAGRFAFRLYWEDVTLPF